MKQDESNSPLFSIIYRGKDLKERFRGGTERRPGKKAFPAMCGGSSGGGYWITVLTAEEEGKRWWKRCYGAAELPRGAGEFAVDSPPSPVVSKNRVVSVGDR